VPTCYCAACGTELYRTVHPEPGVALATAFPAGRFHGEGNRYYLVCPGSKCGVQIEFRLDETKGANMMVPSHDGTVRCD
jgi:hypothetical protein